MPQKCVWRNPTSYVPTLPILIGLPEPELQSHLREEGSRHVHSEPEDTPFVASKGSIQRVRARVDGRNYSFNITGNYCLSSTFSHGGMALSGQVWVRTGVRGLPVVPKGSDTAGDDRKGHFSRNGPVDSGDSTVDWGTESNLWTWPPVRESSACCGVNLALQRGAEWVPKWDCRQYFWGRAGGGEH